MTESLSDSGNDRIRNGGNIDAFTAHEINVTSLREEAGHWLDGAKIESAEQAEAVNTLLDMARKASKAADDARTDEKEPHLKAGREVDAKWKPLITAANTVADVCKQVLTPWNLAERQRKEAEAARARAEAEAEAEAAREAMQASSGDMSAREQAEQIDAAAKQAGKVAKAAEKAAGKGNRLRTTYVAEITDFAAAARHYWQPEHDRFEALVLEFAQRDVTAGRRNIPGVTATPVHKAI